MNQQVAADSGYWTRSGRVADMTSCPAPVPTQAERRREDVRSAVEIDIVPRMLLSRSRAHALPATDDPLKIGGAEVLRFVDLLFGHDDAQVAAHLTAVQARGVPIADIYLDLFQPAARRIGDLWAEDRCSFVDVTLAIGTMQRMLRALAPEFHRSGRPVEGDRQALLVPLPGDQHTFGLTMVTEFFRRAGWSVWATPLASFDDLTDMVRTGWFAVIGFSASTHSRLDELAAAIRLVRRDSCNRDVGVMVGGPIFVEHPDFVARVGADAMGADANEALVRAERFVSAAGGP